MNSEDIFEKGLNSGEIIYLIDSFRFLDKKRNTNAVGNPSSVIFA